MSTSANPVFMGNSAFASDFQTIITNAVSLASLPMQQLTNEKATLTNQVNALDDLNTKFATLQSAIQTLETAATANAAGVSVSNSSVLSATAASGALSGTYTVEVTSMGAHTSTMSSNGLPAVTNPSSQSISTSTTFNLKVDGTNYTINPASNDLNSLAQAINNSGADVQASIVNIGGSASPDYRLTVAGNNLSPDTIQLSVGSTNLLTTLATGSPATYLVNGLKTAAQSNSDTVTLSPGLTVTLLQQSAAGVPTTITVSPNTNAISNALSSIVSDYNAVSTELGQQFGATAGPLNGQSIVFGLQNALRALTTYSSPSGSVSSLASLGVTLDDTGQLSFDPSVLNGNSFDAVGSFLGSSTTGGFLQAATNAMNNIEDPTSGLLTNDIADINSQIADETTMIAKDQDSVNLLQQSLQTKMAAADALIAGMEQKVNYIDGLFQAMFPSNNSSSGG